VGSSTPGHLLGHRLVSLALDAAALKNPSCLAAVEGSAQSLAWSAACAPAKYEDLRVFHGYHHTAVWKQNVN
jgi:hypothetical protein